MTAVIMGMGFFSILLFSPLQMKIIFSNIFCMSILFTFLSRDFLNTIKNFVFIKENNRAGKGLNNCMFPPCGQSADVQLRF